MNRASGWSTSRGDSCPTTAQSSRCSTTILFKAEQLPSKQQASEEHLLWPLGVLIKTKCISSSLISLLFPRWVRGEHFRYKFSQPGSSSAAQGKWWLRKRIGAYFPPVNLEGLRGYFQSRNWPHPLTHPNRTWEEISVVLQRWRKGHMGQNSRLGDKLACKTLFPS